VPNLPAWRASPASRCGTSGLAPPAPGGRCRCAAEGTVRNRSGDRYRPSALRGYAQALRNRTLAELGGARLSEVARADLQGLADRLLDEGLDASTIRNAFLPVRAIFRRAAARGEVAVNPTSELELPAVRGRRDRIASSPGGGGAARRPRRAGAGAVGGGVRRRPAPR